MNGILQNKSKLSPGVGCNNGENKKFEKQWYKPSHSGFETKNLVSLELTD